MKKLMTFLSLSISAFTLLGPGAAHASTLQCGNGFYESGPNYSLIFDYVAANCSDENNNLYKLKIRGAGPTVGTAMLSAMFIECPNADGIEGVYYGVKASAAVLLGLRAGVIMANNGRTCFIGGGDFYALQAGVTINKIEIRAR